MRSPNGDSNLESAVLLCKSEIKGPPRHLTELTDLSNGIPRNQSAPELGISWEELSLRRIEAMSDLGARTMAHAIAVAIEDSFLPIEVERVEQPILPPKALAILKLLASGLDANEIAARYSISVNSVYTHYEDLRTILQAKNKNHAIRRAYELGLFKVGEKAWQMPTIAAVGRSFDLDEIGLFAPAPLEFLRTLGRSGLSAFRRINLYDIGLFENAVSENARAQLFKRTMRSVIQKSGVAFDTSLISGGSRDGIYKVDTPFSVVEGTQIFDIPAYKDGDYLPAANRPYAPTNFPKPKKPEAKPRAKNKPNHPKPSVASKTTRPKVTNSLAFNDFLDPDALPEINEELLSTLGYRDKAEIKSSERIREAVTDLIKSGERLDYRQKIVLAMRFGAPLGASNASAFIKRTGSHVRLSEIARCVPNWQGLQVEDVSKLTGLHPIALLDAEIDFLTKKIPPNLEVDSLIENLMRDKRKLEDKLQ